jgi:hypothetical protein
MVLRALCERALRPDAGDSSVLVKHLSPVFSELQYRAVSSRTISEFLAWLNKESQAKPFVMQSLRDVSAEAASGPETQLTQFLDQRHRDRQRGASGGRQAATLSSLTALSQSLHLLGPSSPLQSDAKLGLAVHELVRECVVASDDSKAIALKAAECLGEIGVVDTMLLSQPVTGFLILKLDDVKVATLAALCGYVLDDDVRVVEAAATALRECFDCVDCRAAINALDDATKEDLKPFSSVRSKFTRSADAARAASIDDPVLWATESCKYSDWITRISSTLASSLPRSTFFGAVAPVCAVKVELAEFLLGPILVAVSAERASSIDQIQASSIPQWIQQEVLSPANENMEALKMTLSALVYLREINTADLVEQQKKRPQR